MYNDRIAANQGGYRLDYASSNRSKCSGPKPCSGSRISKGELRLGTLIDYNGNMSYKWRHWGCTSRIDLDKDRVRVAWTEGQVAVEDIPEISYIDAHRMTRSLNRQKAGERQAKDGCPGSNR
ncbi:hypothetical protein B0J17DRAFT_230932 [Rhizoctonia solani]|nr:hypothetical protein B0J17DRAFT_230932 [Rhizoctonia solani]